MTSMFTAKLGIGIKAATTSIRYLSLVSEHSGTGLGPLILDYRGLFTVCSEAPGLVCVIETCATHVSTPLGA